MQESAWRLAHLNRPRNHPTRSIPGAALSRALQGGEQPASDRPRAPARFRVRYKPEDEVGQPKSLGDTFRAVEVLDCHVMQSAIAALGVAICRYNTLLLLLLRLP